MLCWCNIYIFFRFSVSYLQLSKLVDKDWRNKLSQRNKEMDGFAFQKLIVVLNHIAWDHASGSAKAKLSLSALISKPMKSQAEDLWESILAKNVAAEVNSDFVRLNWASIGETGKEVRDLGSSWSSAPILTATCRALWWWLFLWTLGAMSALKWKWGSSCFKPAAEVWERIIKSAESCSKLTEVETALLKAWFSVGLKKSILCTNKFNPLMKISQGAG